MARSIADQLRQAFADADEVLPTDSKRPVGTLSLPLRSASSGQPTVEQKSSPTSIEAGKKRPANKPKKSSCNRSRARLNGSKPQPMPDLSCYGQPAVTKSVRVTHDLSAFELSMGSNPRVAVDMEDQKEAVICKIDESLGRQTQIAGTKSGSPLDIVLGLDFGTSSIKAIVGDPYRKKAFAVPFVEHEGVGRYLLPSRLFETRDVFSISRGLTVHRDLKLAMLASPDDRVVQDRVIAFLALVIRHSRAWFLKEQFDIYRNHELVWKVSIGIPAEHHLETNLSKRLESVTRIAWLLAAMDTRVDAQAISVARSRCEAVSSSVEPCPLDEDVQIDVIPEIAAQIYGFVNSGSFDKKATNFYLMVDVGAGTIDASLFHVAPAPGGRWDFSFFTCVVEPNGAINLHRERVRWWLEALRNNEDMRLADLSKQLEAVKFATDLTTEIPDWFGDYLHDVSVLPRHGFEDPDQHFKRSRALVQVKGKTLWRAAKEGYLNGNAIKGIPFFFCGGGTRIPLYQGLAADLQQDANVSWLRASRRELTVPERLEAPGLPRDDYHRLSVAYGLSFMDVGRVLKALPMTKLPSAVESDWANNYTSKDLC